MSDQFSRDPATLAPKGGAAVPLRESLLDRSPARAPSPVSTMVRVHDAMHRLERLAEAMEKAAEEGEKQLAMIKGRL
jgi:hypothetical protein